jgi:4-hydroxybenzoyl-CoA thioesterase
MTASASHPRDARGTAFRRPYRIRFSDCDPAGIVFYPQYFVMLNGHVEDWFGAGLGIPYRSLILDRRIGLPSVRLEVDFTAVSRMGDEVELALTVERLGRASITLAHAISARGEARMAMRQVLVVTSLHTHRAIAIPDDVRAALVERGYAAGEPPRTAAVAA